MLFCGVIVVFEVLQAAALSPSSSDSDATATLTLAPLIINDEQSKWLGDVFQQMDTSSDTLHFTISPTAPYFCLATRGPAGTSEVSSLPASLACGVFWFLPSCVVLPRYIFLSIPVALVPLSYSVHFYLPFTSICSLISSFYTFIFVSLLAFSFSLPLSFCTPYLCCKCADCVNDTAAPVMLRISSFHSFLPIQVQCPKESDVVESFTCSQPLQAEYVQS